MDLAQLGFRRTEIDTLDAPLRHLLQRGDTALDHVVEVGVTLHDADTERVKELARDEDTEQVLYVADWNLLIVSLKVRQLPRLFARFEVQQVQLYNTREHPIILDTISSREVHRSAPMVRGQ